MTSKSQNKTPTPVSSNQERRNGHAHAREPSPGPAPPSSTPGPGDIKPSPSAASLGPVRSRLFDYIQQAGKARGPSGTSLRFRNASNGYWVATLLPLAIYLGDIEIHQRQSLTATTIVLLNSLLLCVIRACDLDFYMLLQRLRRINICLGLLTLLICWFHGGSLYEITSYVALHFTFPYLFYNLIRQHPRSFSFGEGVLATTAFAYQFWKTSQNLPFPPIQPPIYQQTEKVIVVYFLELVFFGSILAARVCLLLVKPWKLFILEEMLCLWAKYCAMAFFIRVPIFNDEIAAFLSKWPFKFLVATRLRVLLLVYWCLISILTGIFLFLKAYSSRRATSTMDRKVFHFAIVLVFLPGIFWDTTMVYCCSAVLFFIFGLVETIRVLKFEMLHIKIGEAIDNIVGGFRDSQDQGRLLLTPIYLLVGCSLPIWLTGLRETDNKDLEAVQYAAALTGVLSIGIGDTFASIGGTYYGRNNWKGSKKTLEGTIFSIISQIIVASIIFMSGVIPYTNISVTGLFLGIFVNAIVEGNTNQIDNLVLPLITYIVVHAVHLSSFIIEKGFAEIDML